MVAGRILSQHCNFTDEEEVYILNGHYECLEMIGRERIEEIIKP